MRIDAFALVVSMSLERWAIVHSPTEKDPGRHTLRVKADQTDLLTLIRKLGALCGRPRAEGEAGEFSFRIHLYGLNAGGRERVERILMEINPRALRPPAFPTLGASPLETLPAVAAGPAPSVPEITAPKRDPAPSPPPTMPASSADPLAAPTPAFSPSGAKTPPPMVGAAAAPVADALEIAPPSAASPRAEQPLWGVAAPVEASFTMESFTVGPFNRFAHAAGMAVVSNPGSMYNPLLVYGRPGTGKSHLLTALGAGIESAAQGQTVGFTTGPRLAKAMRLAAAGGKAQALEEHLLRSRAIMIDDIHLMTVTEQNQPGLRSLFERFFGAGKHVAMTSVYAPRALAALEDALGFKISAGWSVEVKSPGAEAQKEILAAGLARSGFPAEGPDLQKFLEGLSGDFSGLARWLFRLKALALLRSRSGHKAALRELLPLLFIPDSPAAGGVPAADLARLMQASGEPPAPEAGSKSLQILYPQGHEEHARFMARQIKAAAGKNGLPYPFREALRRPYDPDLVHGLPFALAEACDRSGAAAALALGPTPGSAVSSREAELQHALEHLLGGLEVPLGWIPFARIQQPGPYFRALLDLSPVFSP